MTFEELGPSQCRWPVAEICDEAEWCSFLFCGEAAVRKRSYCQAHLDRAYKDEHPIRIDDKRRRRAVVAESLCFEAA
jgi:hypothetical protein